jgi:hypothetical protein
MPGIYVSFEVTKALFALRRTEDMTDDDVLREVLKLKPASKKAEVPKPDAWVVKGVTFPAGTLFRAHYKGKAFAGHVANGAMVLSGKAYSSLSQAARSVTDSAINGWIFWEVRTPGTAQWRLARDLRPTK